MPVMQEFLIKAEVGQQDLCVTIESQYACEESCSLCIEKQEQKNMSEVLRSSTWLRVVDTSCPTSNLTSPSSFITKSINHNIT